VERPVTNQLYPYTTRDDERLVLIGIRCDPDTAVADFYSLFVWGGKDRPLRADGRILLAGDPRSAPRIAQLADEDVVAFPVPTTPDVTCDVAMALHLLGSGDSDDRSSLLNCLNTLFDLVEFTEVPWPDGFRRPLVKLADHLTFDPRFGELLATGEFDRRTAVDGVLWCLGAVLASARFVR
jgi:hypothetical protein